MSHAAIEVEALAVAYPWPERDIAFDHTGILADSSRRHGYRLLLVSATVQDADYLRRLVDALATDDLLLVFDDAGP